MFIGHFAVGFALKRAEPKVPLGVMSHWVLDYITHREDMPLAPNAQKLGLGLWNSLAGTLVVELARFALGISALAARKRAATGLAGQSKKYPDRTASFTIKI